jgi:hypothetical protein
MIMRRFFSLFISLISIYTAYSQDIATFFIAMPNQYLPQMEEAWRKDLVGLYQSGKQAELDNAMDGRSTLQKMTSDYLFLQISDRSSLEIKLLPLINQTFVACVITTVFAPVPDSRVEFFTLDWHPLPASELWKQTDTDSFIKKDIDRDAKDFREAISYVDMELIHYRLDPDQLTMTAEYTTPVYLSGEEREQLKPFLKDSPLVYQWKSGKFEF